MSLFILLLFALVNDILNLHASIVSQNRYLT